MNSRAKEIFREAYVTDPEERDTFLAQACGDDAELRLEVQRMLVESEAAQSFFGDEEDDGTQAEDLNLERGAEREGDVIGPYTLRQEIGEGGFGVVWMAEQSAPIRRMVALKVVKAGMDTRQVLARFEAERQALALMDHPNIARVLDAGATANGRPYFAMELVKGVPITAFCNKQKYGPRRRLELFRDVCSAVNHAHQKGVIHRDLKPSNVMVTLAADVPVVKIIDFGIAKATHNKLTDKTLFTRYEQFLGTPAYMSPEQAELSSLDVDTRSDLYSLGILLYELLAGKPPFDQKTLLSAGYDEMRRIIAEDEPPKPSTRATQTQASDSSRRSTPRISPHALRGDLDWIVMKAIEKDRTRRYETANAFAADIGRYLQDEPVLAAAPSATYKFRKFARRNKTVLGVAAGFALVLIAATSVSTWQAWQATQARQQSEEDRDAAEVARGDSEAARAKAEAATVLAVSESRKNRRNRYNAEMNFAALAFSQDEGLGELLRITDDWLPGDGEEDLRGWEWFFLRSVAQQESKAVQAHDGWISDLRISPDGTKVASCGADRMIRVLDSSLEKELLAIGPLAADLLSLSWDPTGDLLVCADRRGAVCMFDTANREEIWKIDLGSAAVVSFSHGGDHVSVGFGRPGTVAILDASNGSEIRRFECHPGVLVREVVWRPGDGQVAVAHYWGGLSIWNVDTGERVSNFESDAFSLECAAWSSGGTRIAFGGREQIIWVYDADSGRQLHELTGSLHEIDRLSWSPDGELVASTGELAVRLWNLDRGGTSDVLRGHRMRTSAVDWDPTGEFLVSGDVKGDLNRWELDNSGLATTVLETKGPINGIAWSPDGKLLASACEDGFVRVVNAATHELNWSYGDSSSSEAFVDAQAKRHGATTVAWSHDGTHLATGGWGDRVFIWDYAMKKNRIFTRGGGGMVFEVVYPRDDNRLFVCSTDQMSAWDLTSGTTHFSRPIERPWTNFPTVSVSPSGDLFAISVPSAIEIRFSEDGELFRQFPRGGGRENAPGFAWSPDEQRIAIAMEGGLGIRIWDLDGKSDPMILRGHAEDVLDVDWSSDGTRLVSAGKDRTCRVWDPATGTQLLVLREHENRVVAAKWSPDGKKFASGSADGTVKIWDASKGYAEQGESPGPRSLPVPIERIARSAEGGAVEDILVPPGSEWRWLHPIDGVDPAEDDEEFHRTFFTPEYDDESWNTGTDSLLGFGYGDPVGIDIGTPPEGQRFTAYFRHEFTTTKEHLHLALRCKLDDGLIIYLDGQEIGRQNMPPDTEDYDLAATRPVSGHQERATVHIPLDAEPLPPGDHVLAISLHNASPTSSDLRIAGISLVETQTAPPVAARNQRISLPEPKPLLEDYFQVDLSEHYNTALDGPNWASASINLARLPETFRPLHGVSFQLEGIIQLQSGNLLGASGRTVNQFLGLQLKPEVTGIVVNKATPRIHFLTSCKWGGRVPGEKIAHFVMHYEDGTEAEKAVVIGPDGVDDWVRAQADVVVGWKGPIHASGNYQGVLSELIWENPHSEKVIKTIDFVSDLSPHGVPFLVAITLE